VVVPFENDMKIPNDVVSPVETIRVDGEHR